MCVGGDEGAFTLEVSPRVVSSGTVCVVPQSQGQVPAARMQKLGLNVVQLIQARIF